MLIQRCLGFANTRLQSVRYRRVSRREIGRKTWQLAATVERFEDRTLLSNSALLAGADATLATVRGASEIQGEVVMVDILFVVPNGSDANAVGQAALESVGARPLQPQEFSTTGLVWDQFFDASPGNDFVTQYYNDANDPTGGGEAALLASHATWNAVASSTFTITYGGTTDRLPSLVRESPGKQFFDGFNDVAWMDLRDRNALAVTWSGSSTDEADMAMNTDFAWFTDGFRNFDAETVFLHENGHVAGLGHTDVDGAVMEPVYAGVRRDLHQDDIDGISSLYSAVSGDSAPTVAVTSPSDGDPVSGTISITADAGDDVEVSQVEFFVDGSSLGVDTTDPYAASWDTTLVSDGVYTITATATDTIGQTSSHSIDVTVDNVPDPPSVDPEMYVWDLAWSERQKGPNSELRVTVDVNQDSDNDGLAESGDDPAAAATVTLVLTHDTDGDGVFEPGTDDSSWTGVAETNGQGLVSFRLNNAPSGDYEAEVTDLSHATFVWNAALDNDSPDQYVGLPNGTDALAAPASLTRGEVNSAALTSDEAAAEVVRTPEPGDPGKLVAIEITVAPSGGQDVSVSVDTATDGDGPPVVDVQNEGSSRAEGQPLLPDGLDGFFIGVPTLELTL